MLFFVRLHSGLCRQCHQSVLTLNSSPFRRYFSFITTPIFYVNSYPHLGHLYSLLLSDAGNRFYKLKNPQSTSVLFTTGTDEHGRKVEQAADSSKLPVNHYCDNISKTFKNLCEDFNVSNTDFIRTTESRHCEAVSEFWKRLTSNGHIYKGSYEGWYSVNDEAFLAKNHPVVDKIEADGKLRKVSQETGRSVEWISEDNYMFNLNSFSSSIRKWISNDKPIYPEIFVNQILKWLEEDLPALSLSRPSTRLSWGIPVPDDPSHVIYVWFDALVNYLTVAGFPSSKLSWPPTVQVVGKDILRFHSIYWPAFLLAGGLDLPQKILCHSHWTVDDVKMSKSLGNVVDPYDLRSKYGEDAVRYFLLREGVPHSDGNFNEEKLLRLVNAELADTLGNLLSRCAAPALNPLQIWPKFVEASFPNLTSKNASHLRESVECLPDKVNQSYECFNFYRGIEHIMTTLRLANLFVEEEKPWTLVKISANHESLQVMTSIVMETLRICGTLLLPIIPNMATHLLGMLKKSGKIQTDRLNVTFEQRNWNGIRPFIWEKPNVDKMLQEKSSVLFRRIRRSGISYKSLQENSVRLLHTSSKFQHGEYEWKDPEKEEDVVMITVYNKDGKLDRIRGKVGDNLLYLCKRFNVDMEGACEASLACTTCHVYVNDEFQDLLPEASETEEDLLDQAPFLKNNSRLGCQIILKKEYDGMIFQLPSATKNFYVDGHKPAHH